MKEYKGVRLNSRYDVPREEDIMRKVIDVFMVMFSPGISIFEVFCDSKATCSYLITFHSKKHCRAACEFIAEAFIMFDGGYNSLLFEDEDGEEVFDMGCNWG